MSVAKVIEIICCSPKSFDDAIRNGIAEAAKTLHGIKAAWVKDKSLCIENAQIAQYKVILHITFEIKK
jgi:flavin-binding protein dodecin